MSVLFALNSEEYVCRKVCQPMCCVIPTLLAAGRIIVRMRHDPNMAFVHALLRVFGRELELHPLVAIFTLMIGASVGGLAGAYLSLPIAAVIRVVCRMLDHSSAQPIDIGGAQLPVRIAASG